MSSDILTEIMTVKRRRIAEAKAALPLETLQDNVSHSKSTAVPRALTKALSNTTRLNVIAEFKRRSPSKGMISEGADPRSVAREYQDGGACAISVLTEEDFFAGSLDDLRSVRASVSVPVLRKDFVFDEYQLWESAAAGASAVLLIVAALSDEELVWLRSVAEEQLGLDALIEIHSEAEMDRAVAAGARLIGVNNRNLRTFDVSLTVSERLAERAPKGTILVSESGLRTRADLLQLREVGYSGFLIGETLMRSNDPKAALKAFLSDS
jgi:indole-3-glycerol phosphate synthase